MANGLYEFEIRPYTWWRFNVWIWTKWFKICLGEDQDLEYIQDFADVLFEYRREHEITDLPFDELNDLIKRYIGIYQYEIETRKPMKKQNISDEKSYQKK